MFDAYLFVRRTRVEARRRAVSPLDALAQAWDALWRCVVAVLVGSRRRLMKPARTEEREL